MVTMPDSQQILIASDHAPEGLARAALEQRGFVVTVAQDLENAYAQLLDSSFDLVIMDVERAEKGVEFVKRLRTTPKLSKTFVLTIAEWGTGQPTLALSQGADAFEPKPIDATRLVGAAERLLRQRVAKTAAATNAGRLENNE
jgi:DNA-binding response OmpR family regulator